MELVPIKNKLTSFLLIFTLVNIVFALLLGLRLWMVVDTIPSTFYAWVFAVAMYIGQIAVFCILGIFLLPYILICCRIHRLLVFTLTILAAGLISIVIIADTEVYRFFGWHINSTLLTFAISPHLNDLSGMSWKENSIILAVIFICFLLQTGIAYLIWRFITNRQSIINKKKLLLITLLFCPLSIASHVMYITAQAMNYHPIINSSYLLPFYYTPSINPELIKLGILPQEKADSYPINIPFFINETNYKLLAPLHPLQYENPAKPLNVVLILVDALRFDMVNAEVAPHLTQFSKQSLQFTNHYSGGNETGPGVFSLLYSLPYAYWNLAIAAKQPASLFTALATQQYQLGIYASAPLSLPEFSRSIFAGVPDVKMVTPGNSPWQRDQQITQNTIRFLQERAVDRKPFFNMVFYDSVHSYSLPPDFQLQFQPIVSTINRMDLSPNVDPIPLKNLYKNTVYYVDGLIESVLLTLKQTNLLENTIVIITSDHGEEFNDNKMGNWGHGSNFTDYQAKVPFIIYWPKKTPQVLTHMTSHYDFVPTLMQDVLGVKNPYLDYSIGNSIFSKTDRPFVISSSYGYTAVIQPNKITSFIPGAGYRITDKNLKILLDDNYDRDTIQQVDQLLRRYSKGN